MRETDTPRTDRDAAEFYESEGVAGCSVHIARQLERELAEAKRERDEAIAAHQMTGSMYQRASHSSDVWKARCKEAQRCLGEASTDGTDHHLTYACWCAICLGKRIEWQKARDAGKDE